MRRLIYAFAVRKLPKTDFLASRPIYYIIFQAFQAISGKDGALIWNFDTQDAKNDIMNLYTAQLIKDIDGDGVVDVLAIHGGDPLQDPGMFYMRGSIRFYGYHGQSACLVVNPITVYSYGFLFNCTTVGRASDSMTALT